MKRPFVSVVCSLGLASSLAFFVSAARAEGEAKNVVFFLGDGMGPTTVTATRIFKVGEHGRLTMETFPRTARIRTYSNDAQTTDSAPSMSAYMTGVKMNNDVISMSASTLAKKDGCTVQNGHPVPTLLELAKASGRAVGAVTTTEATHATPAATYAHICHRDLAYEIARQAVPGGEGYNTALGTGVNAGLNVLFGGGQNHFVPSTTTNGVTDFGRPDGRNLLTELQGQGFTVITDRWGLESLKGDTTKVVGLFAKTGHLNYDLDRVKDAPDTRQPSLREMAEKAVSILQHASEKSGNKGYFLMVEGGRIDHALHATNAARALAETAAFDDAIAGVLARVDLKQTLLVVTADHDHTIVLNGYAKRGNSPLDIVKGHDGSAKKDADGLTYPAIAYGNGPNREDVRTAIQSADAMNADYKQPTAFKLASETHGGGDVMLMATGAGSSRFKGVIDNTKVFALVRAALGL